MLSLVRLNDLHIKHCTGCNAVENLKLHTVSEQYSTLIMNGKKEIGAGKKQMDEKDASIYMHCAMLMMLIQCYSLNHLKHGTILRELKHGIKKKKANKNRSDREYRY